MQGKFKAKSGGVHWYIEHYCIKFNEARRSFSFVWEEIKMNNKAITPRNEDFAKWYTDVVRAARLAAYSNVKCCTVI